MIDFMASGINCPCTRFRRCPLPLSRLCRFQAASSPVRVAAGFARQTVRRTARRMALESSNARQSGRIPRTGFGEDEPDERNADNWIVAVGGPTGGKGSIATTSTRELAARRTASGRGSGRRGPAGRRGRVRGGASQTFPQLAADLVANKWTTPSLSGQSYA